MCWCCVALSLAQAVGVGLHGFASLGGAFSGKCADCLLLPCVFLASRRPACCDQISSHQPLLLACFTVVGGQGGVGEGGGKLSCCCCVLLLL
jgi:hypothetical protein